MNNRDYSHILLIGGQDFLLREPRALQRGAPHLTIAQASIRAAWATLLEQRPDIVVLEIGHQMEANSAADMRGFLAGIRERGDGTYVIAVLSSPERLLYGGELLFEGDTVLSGSGLLDMFAAPPAYPDRTTGSLADNLLHAIGIARRELERRAQGVGALPKLNDACWAQTICDPRSRELWLQWLPRYASYLNENPVIIGETGTGKTNLARAIHALSGRQGEFVSITPRDFSSSELVQAELFGSVEGAYTGAVDRWGLVHAARGGTLFLDELQSIDRDLQGKLITFIENKAYRRVGGSESISADVRFTFASNRSLDELRADGTLRDDFAYRLERIQLPLLPLRERALDIPASLAYALAKVKRQRPQMSAVPGLTLDAYAMLLGYNWPGNLRQLENIVAQLCEVADLEGRDLITKRIVERVMRERCGGLPSAQRTILSEACQAAVRDAIENKFDSLRGFERRFAESAIHRALQLSDGDADAAAQLLNESVQTVQLFKHRRQSEGPRHE